MRISWWIRENGELVEKWRFEMAGDYARKIDYDLRREEREKAKAQKRFEKEARRAARREANQPPDEMEIFAANVEVYDGTDRGQQDL